jgi:hypothetical protein
VSDDPVNDSTPVPTSSAPGVADRLQPFLLEGGAELNDPNSYQSKAMRRVGEQLGVDFFTESKLVQYYALYSIFAATNAVPNIITDAEPLFDKPSAFPEWANKAGWETNNLDPCEGWYGVVCVEDRVTELNLNENFLTGIWPHEVTLLAADGPNGSSGAGALVKIDLNSNLYLFNNFDNSWMSLLGSTMGEYVANGPTISTDASPRTSNLTFQPLQ